MAPAVIASGAKRYRRRFHVPAAPLEEPQASAGSRRTLLLSQCARFRASRQAARALGGLCPSVARSASTVAPHQGSARTDLRPWCPGKAPATDHRRRSPGAPAGCASERARSDCLAVTTVTGKPSASTRWGRSRRSQCETRAASVEMMISSNRPRSTSCSTAANDRCRRWLPRRAHPRPRRAAAGRAREWSRPPRSPGPSRDAARAG